jgi:hypothetical protein
MIVFGGDLWPLGNGVTFVELELGEGVDAYAEWGGYWGSAPRLEELGRRPVLELMAALLPLQEPYRRRLLAGTTCGWTAVFDNSRSGGDIFPPTYLAMSRGVRAVAAKHVPRSQSSLPATQFHLFGPSGRPPLMYVRTVDAGIFDSGRWQFLEEGPVQPYEETDAYRSRLIRDRLTRERLLRYLDALGIRADDPDWYTAGVLAHATGWRKPGWTGTLEQARAERG